MLFCVGSVCATDPDPTDPFIKKLADDNHQLTIKVYNQSKEINKLKNKLDIQLNENNKLQAEKDKIIL